MTAIVQITTLPIRWAAEFVADHWIAAVIIITLILMESSHV